MKRLAHLRDLLLELVARDLKLRYQRSVLGLGWSLLKPLSQLLVFSYIFGVVVPLTIPHYTTYVFIGVLAWSWFSAGLTDAAISVTRNPELIRKPGFPAAILPALATLTNCIHFLLAAPILLAFAVMDVGAPSWAMLALPLVIALQFAFTVSLAYFVAAFQVMFQDTQHIVSVAMMLGFYMTPVFYQAVQIDARYAAFTQFNPIAQFLAAYRDILIARAWPDWSALFLVALASAIALGIGYAVFQRMSLRFAEEV